MIYASVCLFTTALGMVGGHRKWHWTTHLLAVSSIMLGIAVLIKAGWV